MPQKADDKLIKELAEALSNADDVNEALSKSKKQYKAKKTLLAKKSILFAVTSLVLVVALVALGVAWYTKVANTYSVQLEVADYDLAVNENMENEYVLNAYSYSAVKHSNEEGRPVMAPGTVGWIPLKITTYHGDTDVNVKLNITSHMPEIMRKRIRFYYLENALGAPYFGEALAQADDLTSSTITIQKGENTTNYTKHYLDGDTNELSFTVEAATGDDTYLLCIYWEWYLDANAAYDAGSPLVIADGYTKEAYNDASATGHAAAVTYYDDWNAFDTDVGRYPKKYLNDFSVYISTSGTQVAPSNGIARPATADSVQN